MGIRFVDYTILKLNLEKNYLNISYLYSDYFADLQSLTELNLRGNTPYYIPNGYIADKDFSKLKSLQTLEIDGFRYIKFGK